jgi:hypothetical protein
MTSRRHDGAPSAYYCELQAPALDCRAVNVTMNLSLDSSRETEDGARTWRRGDE